jgi:hypothetical protein
MSARPPELLTAAEIFALPPRPLKVKAKRDGVYLAECCDQGPPPWRHTYFIAWNRIDTPLKLVHWVRHLVEKEWVDSQLIEELIDAVNRRHRIGVWEINP